MITYEKVFDILKMKGLNKSYLRKQGMHPATISKIVKNENISLITVNQLCNLLECEPSDILTYTRD